MRKHNYTEILEQQTEEMWTIINELLGTNKNRVDYLIYTDSRGNEIVVAGRYCRKKREKKVSMGKNGIPRVRY